MAAPPNPDVVFHLQQDNGPESIPVTIRNPDGLARRSVRFRHLVNQAPDASQPIVLRPLTGDGTDCAALRFVLETLASGVADAGGDNCDAPTLCRTCNVLFQYQCPPTSFQRLWQILEPKCSARSVDSGSTSSTTGATRCWHVRKMSPRRAALACQLMTIALVLGERESFEAELAAVVWRSDCVDFATSLPRLANLRELRFEQLEDIWAGLMREHYLLYYRDRELATYIHERLEKANLGIITHDWAWNCAKHPDLREYTPYRYIRKVEEALLPKSKVRADGKRPHDVNQAAFLEEEEGRDSPHVNIWTLTRRYVIEPLLKSSAAKPKVDGTTWADEIGLILQSAEDGIKAKQKQKAEEMMEWTHNQVRIWEAELE